MASYKKIKITYEFLSFNPDTYFVFGDNFMRKANSDSACKTKAHPHAIGFITKKFTGDDDGSFYRPEEYVAVFFEELGKLAKIIERYPSKTFYISKLGSGAANRFRIWEKLVSLHLMRSLERYDNVVFCWDKKAVGNMNHYE
jgi:hypothetical protein